MDIWPIDFNKTLEEINEWFDKWRVERFGSNDTSRYYKQIPFEYDDKEKTKGCYLYGVAEGESLNDEKAKCDKVLDLLLSIKQINDKLSGKALSQHLQWREREQLKEERERLYKAFLDEVQTAPEQAKPQGRPTKPFKDSMLNDINGEKLEIVHTFMDGKKGKDAVAIILACIDIGWMQKPTYGQVKNEFGDIGSKANGSHRISWKPFETLFNQPKGKLRLNYNDIQKTGQPPRDIWMVDKVFE